MSEVKTGSPEDPTVLVNAVIHEASADKCAKYIQLAKDSDTCEVTHTSPPLSSLSPSLTVRCVTA